MGKKSSLSDRPSHALSLLKGKVCVSCFVFRFFFKFFKTVFVCVCTCVRNCHSLYRHHAPVPVSECGGVVSPLALASAILVTTRLSLRSRLFFFTSRPSKMLSPSMSGCNGLYRSMDTYVCVHVIHSRTSFRSTVVSFVAFFFGKSLPRGTVGGGVCRGTCGGRHL